MFSRQGGGYFHEVLFLVEGYYSEWVRLSKQPFGDASGRVGATHMLPSWPKSFFSCFFIYSSCLRAAYHLACPPTAERRGAADSRGFRRPDVGRWLISGRSGVCRPPSLMHWAFILLKQEF